MKTSNAASRQGGTKRQRIAPPPLPVTVVNDLSADIWCGIADFLPKTSRALLAVALTAPPASFRERSWKGQPNALSKAIISAAKTGVLFDTVLDELCKEARVEAESGLERCCKRYGSPHSNVGFPVFRSTLTKQIGQYYNSEWEVMDFVDIPMSLAMRLSDDDLGAILVCIDAKNNLTRLKLTHCFNVVGTGLGPLRGSTVVQYLDLEIAREFEQPWYMCRRKEGSDEIDFDKIMLLEGPVFEVLDTILWEEGNTFTRFQYPYKWYDNASEPDVIKILYGRNQIMRAERFNQFVSDHNAVVNKFACCLYFGSVHEGGIVSFLEKVNRAEDDANICIGCGECSEYSNCSHCNEIICINCCETIHCSECDVRHCPSCCADHELVEKVTFCGDKCHYDPYCSTCRLDSCKNGNYCDGCKKMAFDALLEECNTMQSKLDAQRLEIERLNRGITNEETDELGDRGSPNNQTGNVNVENETRLEPDTRQRCSRCNRMIVLHGCFVEDLHICSGCNVSFCEFCNSIEGLPDNIVTFCRECDGDEEAYCCNECRLKRRRSDRKDCWECKVATFYTLLAEYNMKQAQIDSQLEEIERLSQG